MSFLSKAERLKKQISGARREITGKPSEKHTVRIHRDAVLSDLYDTESIARRIRWIQKRIFETEQILERYRTNLKREEFKLTESGQEELRRKLSENNHTTAKAAEVDVDEFVKAFSLLKNEFLKNSSWTEEDLDELLQKKGRGRG